jgi:archaemetzincin
MKIYIAPLKFSNKEVTVRLVNELSGIFSVHIDTIHIDIDLSDSYSSERKQYHSTKIIESAINKTESASGKILLITEADLYVPVLTFVFGEAQLGGNLSIVSVCRLHEEFYTGHTNEELFYERTKKEVLHELGHTFGLLHCFDWDCVMHSSNSVEEVDIKGNIYCKHCFDEIKNHILTQFKK